jgi:AraC-like DNA-binding protein
MDWRKNMNRAIEYIEENLAGEIDMETAARFAGCSRWEFYCIFSFVAHIPLSEYIRRRESQPWGAIECGVTTIDGSILRFFETT